MALSRLRSWLDESLGWSELTERWGKLEVSGANPVHYTGAAMMFAFVFQGISGVLLMFHYEPHATTAYASTQRLIGEVPFGELLRAAHLWCSDLALVCVGLHLLTILLRRSYRHPRGLAWMAGVLTFFCVGALAYTGAILPWGERAYQEARVGSDLVGHVPGLGNTLRSLMRGGQEVAGHTLHHAFSFHVALLPAALVLLVGLNLFLLRRAVGWSHHHPEGAIPFYPDFLIRQAALCVLCFALVVSLATFVQRPLGAPLGAGAAALSAVSPPWFLLFVHVLVTVAPAKVLGVESATVIAGGIAFLLIVLFLLPLIDRRGSKATITAALATVVVLIGLTVYGLV